MNFKEWLLKFVEDKWALLVLLVLFFILMISHAIQLHWKRPLEVVHWNEGMIAGVFAAIIAKLKD